MADWVLGVETTAGEGSLALLRDGAPAASNLALINLYLAANTPTEVPQGVLDGIVKTTAGTSLQCKGQGVLHFLIRYSTR